MTLIVFHGEKKLDAERAEWHKEKSNEQKSDNLQFLGRHWSSVLTIHAILEHSYPTILILQLNFIIQMLFLFVDLYCSTCSFVTSDNRET